MGDILSTGNKDLQAQKAQGQAQGQPPVSPIPPSPPVKTPPMGPTPKVDFNVLTGQPFDYSSKPADVKNDPNKKHGYVKEGDTYSLYDEDGVKVGTNLIPDPKIKGNWIQKPEKDIDLTQRYNAFSNQVKIGDSPVTLLDDNMKYVKDVPAGPTVPEGVDWKRVLLTIGDALGGAFKGQAMQNFDSVGMQQALQRQANEQKKKEFEQASDAQKQQIIDEANIKAKQINAQVQNDAIARTQELDARVSMENARNTLETSKFNAQTKAAIISALSQNDPDIAIEMLDMTKEQKTALHKMVQQGSNIDTIKKVIGGN